MNVTLDLYLRRLGLLTGSACLLATLGCSPDSGSGAHDSDTRAVKSSTAVGATTHQVSDSPALQWQPIRGAEGLTGSRGWSLQLEGMQQPSYLLASQPQGLLLKAADGQEQARIKGRFEQIDVRRQAQRWLLATVDSEANQLVLISLTDDGRFQRLGHIEQLGFQLDGVCLYQSPTDLQTYVFVTDGDGQVQQWWLDATAEQAMTVRSVRDFYVGPEADSCSADDHMGMVYFNEPGTGIWQYTADAERPLERWLVAATEPHGALAQGISGLMVVPGQQLLALNEESGQLYQFLLADDSVSALNQWTLPQMAELKSVSLTMAADQSAQVVVFDDAADQYWHSTLSAEVSQLQAVGAAPAAMPVVAASVETPPMDRFGDAADDPAIWVHAKQPEQSLILGTHKRRGLYVYDMKGRQLQVLESGRLNNVDVRYGLELNGKTVDIATASNRTNNSISIFSIDRQSREVALLTEVATPLKDVYGLCMYTSAADQSHYVFINDKDGTFLQYQLQVNAQGIDAKQVRSFQLPSQPEGCVADDQTAQLYMGEEDEGVWLIGAEADAGTESTKILSIGGDLHDDVEGLAIAYGTPSYLVISSQGNNSYVLADLQPPYAIKGAFRVGINGAKGIDGASETDGLAVNTANLGGDFSAGLMVVQDGYNVLPSEPQNFKFIAWDDIRQQVLD